MFSRTCLFLGIVIPNIIFICWYFHEVFHHLSDIDECEIVPTPTCELPKICINTRGGYQCVCDGTQYGDDCQHSKLILLNTLKFTAKHFLTLHSITYHQLGDTVGSVVAGYSIFLAMTYENCFLPNFPLYCNAPFWVSLEYVGKV